MANLWVRNLRFASWLSSFMSHFTSPWIWLSYAFVTSFWGVCVYIYIYYINITRTHTRIYIYIYGDRSKGPCKEF